MCDPVLAKCPKIHSVGKHCVNGMMRKVTVSAEIHDFILDALTVRVIACDSGFAAVPPDRIVALSRAGVFTFG